MGQALGEWFGNRKSAFWSGFGQGRNFPKPKPRDSEINRLSRLVAWHHEKHIEASTALSDTRDKLIAAQRELSAVKRKG
jgi:hypothetical protein